MVDRSRSGSVAASYQPDVVRPRGRVMRRIVYFGAHGIGDRGPAQGVPGTRA
jgi:hypothetical protein